MGPDMFCTNCGASNKKDSKFCINCAESFSEASVGEKLSRPRPARHRSYLKKVDFLRPLFDFSFSQFVSPRTVKFLYSLSILYAVLFALFLIVVGFRASTWFGIFALLVGAPLILLLTVISSRVFLEMILVISRMAARVENMRLVDIEENPESRDDIEWNV
jgi:hypothetical protein